MTRGSSLAAMLAVAQLTLAAGLADTYVGGLVCQDTTWTAAGNDYIVTQSAGGSILVGCGATLTIEPGVVVKFDDGLGLTVGSEAYGRGTLVARGTEAAPIRFTSSTGQQPGRWVRVYFTDHAEDATFQDGVYQSGSALEYVIVEYAGAGDVAAIKARWSAPWLARCQIRDNRQRGVYVAGSDAPPIRIESCLIAGNAGGVQIYGGSGHLISGNTITGNHDSFGGAIRVELSSFNTFSGNTLTDNGAYAEGGAMAFYSCHDNTISGNTISGNSTSSGGGLYFESGGGHVVSGNAISGNSASWRGGGIFFNTASATIEGNTISDNSAPLGGAIGFNELASATLSGNWIVGNSASEEGGAVYLPGTDRVSISDCVIAQNRITGQATTGGIAVNSAAHEISLAGDPDRGVYNTICLNDGYQVRNDNAFRADGYNDIDARYVFWGTCDPAEIAQGLHDYFDDAGLAFVLWEPPVQATLGDLDVDGLVGESDLGLLLADWGCAGAGCLGDCDYDGDTDQADLGTLLSRWGEQCP